AASRRKARAARARAQELAAEASRARKAADRARAAAEAAERSATRASRRVPGYVPGSAVSVGAPNPRAKKAIDFAMSQVGDWYLWGGAGPDRWDCSGLVQGAWGAAGSRLDHYSGSQWAQTQRLPLSQLQPGDLVFFGKDAASIHHVGMYIGNGKMVNAPHTGAQVRVESMYWSDLLPYGGRVR
ncbi:C40 family peptidase, partial [Arsenicicoccus bolidensis]